MACSLLRKWKIQRNKMTMTQHLETIASTLLYVFFVLYFYLFLFIYLFLLK